MSKLTQREKIIGVIASIVVGIGIVYYIFLKPLSGFFENLDDQIFTQRVTLKKNAKIIEKARRLQGAEAKLQAFRQTGTNEETMATILDEIQKKAGELGLKISDLKPERVKSDKYYNRFSVTLTIESSLVNITQFLYVLQSEPYLYEVEEFRLGKNDFRQSDVIKAELVLTKTLIPAD